MKSQLLFKEIVLDPGNFADELKGLRFVQITGLHLKKGITLKYFDDLVKNINALNVDFVFFVGLVFDDCKFHKYFCAFKRLDAKAYYVSKKTLFEKKHDKFKKEMFLNGVKCLDNSMSMLNINNTPLQLVGFSAKKRLSKSDKRPIAELTSKVDENISTILLTSKTEDIQLTKAFRVDIQLSAEHEQKSFLMFKKEEKNSEFHLKGLYVYGRTLLYVSQNLGLLGLASRSYEDIKIPVFTIE